MFFQDLRSTPITYTRKIYSLASLLFLVFATLPLVAQTKEYIIHDVEFFLEGQSKEFAMKRLVPELKPGISFPSEALLVAFLGGIEESLHNIRTLEVSRIDYTLHVVDDTRIEVAVSIYTRDTLNILILPFPKYDDNEGFSLLVKALDYNFLGLQNKLDADLSYNYHFDTGHGGVFTSDYTYPFPIGRHRFYVRYDLSYEYNEVNRSIVDFDVGAGYIFPVATNFWNLGYTQKTYFSEHTTSDSFYGLSTLFLNAPTNTRAFVPHFGKLYYQPDLSFVFPYTYDKPLSSSLHGIDVVFSQELYTDEFNWRENIRDGLYFSVRNTNTYNIVTQILEIRLQSNFKFFYAQKDFGFSGRFAVDYLYGARITDPGSYVRGVLNKASSGNLVVSTNADFVYPLFIIPKFVETHGSFFMDFAVIADTSRASVNDFVLTAGIEALIYPVFARSIIFRMSFGIDLVGLGKRLATMDAAEAFDHSRELFVGIGFHY